MSTLEEKIKVMQHFANGGKVEFKEIDFPNNWRTTSMPAWNFALFEYRIKKEPRVVYVVFNRHGTYILCQNSEDSAKLICARNKGYTYSKFVEEI